MARVKMAGRGAFTLIGVSFTVYHAARSLVWTTPIAHPWLVAVTVVLVAVLTVVAMFIPTAEPPITSDAPLTAGRRGPSRAPVWIGVVAVVMAAATAPAIAIGVGPGLIHAPFATSYLGAVGTMLTVVMIRRRPVLAWLGVIALAVGTMVLLGPLGALSYGLIGATMWVTVAQLILGSLDRASSDTVRLVELQRAAAAWQAAQSVRRRERRQRVQFALQVAGPLLGEVVAKAGSLSEQERREALVAEGTLRDELRGTVLMDARVREAIEGARRRGSVVTVLDEGGLVGVGETDLARIRGEIADVVSGSTAARIIIRTSRQEELAATVVGRGEDDDSVDLWHEVPRHTA